MTTSPSTPAVARRPITAEDLYRFELITAAELSPDGRFVAFTQQRVDKKTEKKFQNLFVINVATGQIRPFTQGDHTDSQPRWSPDSKAIAFLSNRRDEKQSQIFVIPIDGGEARLVTKLDGQFGAIEWSPDGKKLLAGFRRKDAEMLKREKDEEAKKLGIVARHIKRVHYKEDGEGFLPEERWHLVLVDVATGEAKWLTDGPTWNEWDAKWSPDGTRIVFMSNRTPEPELAPDDADVWIMEVASGQTVKVPTPPSSHKGLPRFSPDGTRVAFVAAHGRAQWGTHTQLWVVPADGTGTAVNLTETHDLHFGGATLNDLGGFPTVMAPTWSLDGSTLFMQASRHGAVLVVGVDSTTPGTPLTDLISGSLTVGHYNFDAKQTIVAYVAHSLTDTSQIFVRDCATGTTRQLTQSNAVLLAELDLGEVEELWIPTPSGHRLHGWITKPPRFDPSKQYPSILQIHGGPLAQYGYAMTHEFFYLAAAGYVVHYCNPRGSLGYGEKHARAIWNAWGTVDYDDLMTWTDHIANLPYLDSRRMAVTGGSYGGYMTNWIIARTHRFVAAVTQRCVGNLISMFGSSDYNWHFIEVFGNQLPWDNLANYWAQSPISAIANVRTPTLVIHSEGDYRCAMEQGEFIFVALKKLGVPTELVLFPEEPHGMSRSGRTDRRVSRLQHLRRWFDTFCMGGNHADQV